MAGHIVREILIGIGIKLHNGVRREASYPRTISHARGLRLMAET
jgi:hypothetical protein